MEREIEKDLVEWKEKAGRKPLLLLGARQVGKTWILKDFGRKYFKNFAYINCDNNPDIENLFIDYDIPRILLTISAITHTTITPGETLIILDEIQETDHGLTSLKYFCENASEYHVAVAGSLLGLQLHENESYPVGKVDTLTMYPMNFREFLKAKNEEPILNILNSLDWDAISGLKARYIQNLREYYFVGGMPEAVGSFVAHRDPNAVRKIQKEILNGYEKDISKHAPTEQVIRINQVWRSIPSQIAGESSKFIFGAVKKGARAKDFEIAIQWLMDAGLVYKIPRIKTPEIPLSNFEDISAFKLYMLDCGLLGALSNTPAASLLLPGGLSQSKGAFTENFVCCVLCSIPDMTVGYYSREDSRLEIDFIVQLADLVIPIEVKAEENLQSKSLSTFLSTHSGLHGLRFSMSNYRQQDRMSNVPLYAARVYLERQKRERDEAVRQMLQGM